MILSKRLQTIADNIDSNSRVCDIGTDHGYLPIYLKQINDNRTVILTDISINSLNKAKLNCSKLSKYTFDYRVGNGLEVIEPHEVDIVVIAGMGGLLISKILSNDIEKSHSFFNYILQPRNHIGELRYFLSQNEFSIVNEELVKEGRFICEVLTISNEIPNIDFESLSLPPDAIEWEVPKSLLKLNSELLEDYLNRKLQREKRILFNLNASTNISKEKVLKVNHNINYLNDLIKEYEIKRNH